MYVWLSQKKLTFSDFNEKSEWHLQCQRTLSPNVWYTFWFCEDDLNYTNNICHIFLLQFRIFRTLHLLSQMPIDTSTVTVLENWSPVEDIFSEYWEWRLEQSPEFATSLGVHKYDDSLEKFTFEAFEHRKVCNNQILSSLTNLLSRKYWELSRKYPFWIC